jgi:hypothetical protein
MLFASFTRFNFFYSALGNCGMRAIIPQLSEGTPQDRLRLRQPEMPAAFANIRDSSILKR